LHLSWKRGIFPAYARESGVLFQVWRCESLVAFTQRKQGLHDFLAGTLVRKD